MSGFWNSVHLWLLSIWSHHPTTWVTWAQAVYMTTVTVGLFLVVINRKLNTTILVIAGIAALVTGIGAATLQDSFRFWVWFAIGGILLSKPIAAYRASRKKKEAKT